MRYIMDFYNKIDDTILDIIDATTQNIDKRNIKIKFSNG